MLTFSRLLTSAGYPYYRLASAAIWLAGTSHQPPPPPVLRNLQARPCLCPHQLPPQPQPARRTRPTSALSACRCPPKHQLLRSLSALTKLPPQSSLVRRPHGCNSNLSSHRALPRQTARPSGVCGRRLGGRLLLSLPWPLVSVVQEYDLELTDSIGIRSGTKKATTLES